MKRNNYYVYAHRSNLTGNIFYIGKGTRNRYKSVSNRTSAWKDIAIKGYTSEILKSDLTEETALKYEAELISQLPNLVNAQRKPRPTITLDVYKEYFEVDSESPSGICRLKGTWNGWFEKGNKGVTGTIANKTTQPRWVVSLFGKHIYAHQLVWMLVNGDIPVGHVIDHIDGNALNNCIGNLRLVQSDINARNNRKRTDNTSGVTGVVLSDNVYKARIYLDYKVYSRKFSCNKYGEEQAFRLACEWRNQKIKELNEQGAGYTERHGT